MKKLGTNSILEGLRKIPTASISDALDRMGIHGFMSNEMRPVWKSPRVAGRALTIEDVPSKKVAPPIALLEAVDSAQPGDVIVRAVNDPRRKEIAFVGGIISLGAKNRSVEAMILDGGVRDVDEIESLKLPVFARSLVPSTSVGRTKVRRINRRVTCAGVAVNPRDIVVGDSDGVVVIPQGKLLEAYRMALAIDELERMETKELRRGEPLAKVVRKYARV
jgi:regulator of RNase E activity RraA